MAKDSKITCSNNFKNSDPTAIKTEFNNKIAKIICRIGCAEENNASMKKE
jgi:hypothetical protein